MKGLIINTENSRVKLGYALPVSTDASQWPKQALNEFLAEFPEFTNEDLQVQITRKEPEKGYAIGAILFRQGTIAVPIIIKEFSMSSFDVIVAQNRIMPLTRENLFTLFSNKQAYGTLAPIDTIGNFISMFDPALRAASGEYSMNTYSIKTGEYSFIDNISNSTSSDVKEIMLNMLNSDLSIKTALEKNKNADIIEKIASLKENDKIDVNSSMSHALDRDIHYIYKVANNDYIGIFGSTQAYDPVIVKLTSEDLADMPLIKLAETKLLPGVLQAGIEARLGTAARVAQMAEKGIDPAIAHKLIQNEKDVAGIVAAHSTKKQKIAFLSIKNDQDKQLAVNENMEFAEFNPKLQKFDTDHYKIAVLSETDENQIKYECAIPEAGKKYILKLGDEVSRPWDVVRTTLMGNKFVVDAFDGLTKHSFSITKGINGIFPHETEKNASYIGDSAEWIEVKSSFKIQEPKIEILDTITKVSEEFYKFEGPNLAKYAEKQKFNGYLNFHDAAWGLIQSRADVSALRKFADLKPGQKAEFNSLHACPPSLAKFAELVQEEYTKRFDKSHYDLLYIGKLVKIAAENPLKTTVDAVLSLGFINKDNIEEYVAQIPMYEQVCSDLAKLLLYIRIGMESTPEEPVRKAMQELTRVVERLRGISKLNKID